MDVFKRGFKFNPVLLKKRGYKSNKNLARGLKVSKARRDLLRKKPQPTKGRRRLGSKK